MLAEMEALTPVVMNNVRMLAPFNRKDGYYAEILELADGDYFFETYNVIVWAAIRLPPKRILEIGTRNGGSLIQLLSMYHRFDDVRAVCFDVWRGIGSPRDVRENLKRMNIPPHIVTFVSGDSRRTLPEWKAAHRTAKFDYLLVDGGHAREIAAADLDNVADLAAPGAIVIFDDIGPGSYKLIDVWRGFQAAHREEFYCEKPWRKGVAWAIRRWESTAAAEPCGGDPGPNA